MRKTLLKAVKTETYYLNIYLLKVTRIAFKIIQIVIK